MNNKGTTLVEVVVSILLIAMVMILIFQMLMNLRNEDYISTSKSEDSLVRTEIIHLVENDFINKELKKISQVSCASGGIFCLKFDFYDGTSKRLDFQNNAAIYGDEIWYVSKVNNTYIAKYDVANVKFCYHANTSAKYYYFSMTIPLTHDASLKRKNSIDISYMTLRDDRTISVPTSFTAGGKTISNSC